MQVDELICFLPRLILLLFLVLKIAWLIQKRTWEDGWLMPSSVVSFQV